MIFAIVGFAPDGTRRTWGSGKTEEAAMFEVKEATAEYLLRRRDLGPMDKWTFKPATDADYFAVAFERDI